MRKIAPVTVSTTVARPRQEVYDFLAEFSNHAGFLDHFLVEWEFSGNRTGVGAKGAARVNAPGSQDWTDFEIVEAQPPSLLVEHGVGAKDKRETRGTYRLGERADGGTDVSFELELLQAPRAERMLPPMTRLFLRRTNSKAMRRLKKQLEAGAG
jgi:hypothetical protein